MSLSPFLFLPAALLGPFVLLVIYLRIRLVFKRRTSRAAEEPGRKLPVLFEPKEEAAPGFFLRRFTLPQRTYIREQYAIARVGYTICAWVMFVLLSSSLLPNQIERFDAAFSQPQRVWFSYLHGLGPMIIMVALFSFLAATVAMTYLQERRQGSYVHTWPLSRKFLFWARTGSALATLLASILSATLGSLLLLLIVYGPVWTAALADRTWRGPAAFRDSQATHHFYNVILLVSTSMPRLMLSLLTTATLIFSLFAALDTLSKPAVRKYLFALPLASLIASQYLMGMRTASQTLVLLMKRFKEVLFLYFSLGPPPPWFYALVPIFLSAVLLWLAQIFFARKEL